MKYIIKLKNVFPKSFRANLRLLFYKGKRYECPLCGYRSRTFLKMGGTAPVIIEKQIIGMGVRKGKCMSCFSSDKERLLYLCLKDKLHVFKSAKKLKVLHFAPEQNLTHKMLEAGFDEYVCGDLYPENYPEYVIKIDILDIPFPENYFDVVICNHVLEHVPEDIEAMREIYRVLKANGHSILQVPISATLNNTYEDFSIVDPQCREEAFGQSDHVRIYGQDYVDRLKASGFVVDRINISSEYKHYGVNKDEDIFIGTKNSL